MSELHTIDFKSALRGRSGKVIKNAVVIQDPCYPISHLAFSMRKRWLGGFDLAVHLIDISAWISRDSSLDDAAAERMGSLELPDRSLPLLPLPAKWMSFRVNEQRPSLSLTWRLGKKLNTRSFSIKRTVVRARNSISSADVCRILKGADHEQAGQVQRLNEFAQFLEVTRKGNGGSFDHWMDASTVRVTEGRFETFATEPATQAMLRELFLFASNEAAIWCHGKHLPAVYIQQDTPENLDDLQRISDPVVRTHELERQTPAPLLVSEPLDQTSSGTPGPVSILSPFTRYTDLIVQRQITHHLAYGSELYTKAELDVIRYRATEELTLLTALRHSRERYLTLKHLTDLDSDRTYSAVVLHIGRRGTLVQLLEFSLKTVIHPVQELAAGDRIELKFSGVDLRHSKAHFLVQ